MAGTNNRKIKVISWDVYGTLIASRNDELSDCGDAPLQPRVGVLETLEKVKLKNLIQCTSSDGDLKNLQENLTEAGISLDYFDDFFKMEPGCPKDYFCVLDIYGISPEELLVVGDSYQIDTLSALEQGCQAIWVPESNPKNPNKDIRQVLEYLAQQK